MSGQKYTDMQKKPTLLQIQYLEEVRRAWENQEKCSVCEIARKNGVTHGPVSRYLKQCMANGYLTEDYCLTKAGDNWLDHYLEIREGLLQYLDRLGIPKEERWDNLRDMIENLELPTLQAILMKEKIQLKYENVWSSRQGGISVPEYSVREFIPMGKYPVNFSFLKKNGETGLSMAERGFQKPGTLVYNRKGMYLELTIKEMWGFSGDTNEKMSGHLQSMKYESRGIMKDLPIREKKIRIPFRVFHYICMKKGQFIGSLHVTVTCSVGEKHMPESTANLIFWL